MKKREYIAIIPARYASTRFPAKPLAMLGSKSVIRRVYERVAEVVERVVVATDDERIASHVRAFGGEAVMTSTAHRSGTDRCYEAFCLCGAGEDVIVNVQGDEPFVGREQIETIVGLFSSPTTQIATLVEPFAPTEDVARLQSPNVVKAVVAPDGRALYFSRSVVPYLRGVEPAEWLRQHTYYKHLGIYAFRADVLREVTALEASPLERAESLEQLRWLEQGYTIRVGVSSADGVGIDTPEDLARAEQLLAQRGEL